MVKQKVLITGGAGFIGSELGKFLLTKNFKVILLDNLEYGYRDNFEDNEELRSNFILEDVRSESIGKHLENIDIVIHLAGISSLPECESNPQKAFNVNVSSVANILNACRGTNVKRFIFASTSAVYENNNPLEPFKESDSVTPNLIYATTKYCGERICTSFAQNYDMDILICRFFNVFGPHQDFQRKAPPFTSYLIRELINGRKPTIFNTTIAKRDYIYVSDLVQYLYLMIQSQEKFNADIFNISSGVGYTALEIYDVIRSHLNNDVSYEVGNPIKFWDKYDSLFDKRYNLNKNRIEKEVFKHCIGDNSKIINTFQYSPHESLSEGLKNIIIFQRMKNGY
ncbi:MAG: NAD-dependent epimerase/dehydratase family protein [Anaerolineae bacterium]|nr:NAD-dependent epimerase/dehydratase family protein [Anaerolineae bacterium]